MYIDEYNAINNILSLNYLNLDFYGSHTWWARKLMISDFLNLINIVFNIMIMDW